MLLQEFCQDVIFRHIYLEGITHINFYKFELMSWGNLSTISPNLTEDQLKTEANLINEAIYSLAIGSFDTAKLTGLKETIVRVIGYLKQSEHRTNDNYIDSEVGDPDQTLPHLEEMLKKVVDFKKTNEKLEALTTLRLKLFQEITEEDEFAHKTTKERFSDAARSAGDGSYNNFLARRRATQGYKNACKYIQTGDMAALEAFLEYEKQDSNFFMSRATTKALKEAIALHKLISYADTLREEIASSFAINKERKQAKLKEITNLIKAVEAQADAAQEIVNFKNNPEATEGFQIGFFNIRKSRAAEVVDCLEQVFQNC